MQTAEGIHCTHQAIQVDMPHQIWEGMSSYVDSNVPTIIVRLLHNKLRYIGTNYTQCYLHYWSPKTLVQLLGIIPTIVLLLSLFLVWKKYPKLRLLIAIGCILYPLVFLFELYRLI